jgi:hypothetical protein
MSEPAHDGALRCRSCRGEWPAQVISANQCSTKLSHEALVGVRPGEAGMSGQLLLDRGMFMASVVITDEMQLAPRIAAGRTQERDELMMGVALETASVDFATGHIQRRG